MYIARELTLRMLETIDVIELGVGGCSEFSDFTVALNDWDKRIHERLSVIMQQ